MTENTGYCAEHGGHGCNCLSRARVWTPERYTVETFDVLHNRALDRVAFGGDVAQWAAALDSQANKGASRAPTRIRATHPRHRRADRRVR